MIYDCFTFFNELDLLEIRLETLKDAVDRFVIAEATRTHTGKPKELLFRKNRSRFAAFLDRIEYIVVENLLPEEEVAKDPYNLPWVNENRQRNALMQGLAAANDGDVVMVSDLDEIPRPDSAAEAAAALDKGTAAARFEMRSYNFYINYANFSSPKWLMGTVAAKYGDITGGRSLAKIKFDRYIQKPENPGNTVNKLRFTRADLVLRDAGWHFSFLGGIDAIQKKIAAFSHSEFGSVPAEILKDRLGQGKDLFGRNGRFFAVPVDSSFPEFIAENRSRFADLIFPVDEEYLRRTAMARRMAAVRGLAYRAAVRLVPRCVAPFLVKCRDAAMKRMGRI